MVGTNQAEYAGLNSVVCYGSNPDLQRHPRSGPLPKPPRPSSTLLLAPVKRVCPRPSCINDPHQNNDVSTRLVLARRRSHRFNNFDRFYADGYDAHQQVDSPLLVTGEAVGVELLADGRVPEAVHHTPRRTA